MKAKLGVGVKVVLGQEPVDELKGGVDAHGRAVCLQHGGVFGKDRHARSNDGLRNINGADGGSILTNTFRHLIQCFG